MTEEITLSAISPCPIKDFDLIADVEDEDPEDLDLVAEVTDEDPEDLPAAAGG